MLDPQKRWRPLPDKPDYAGFLSFGGVPLAQEPEDLAGVDVAIVGAPTDDLVSDRPGTRFAPRAIRSAGCPPGPHLEAGVDAFAELKIVDYGDAPVVPADPAASHAAIERIVGEVVDAGVLPVTLGGDHSITQSCIGAIAARRGVSPRTVANQIARLFAKLRVGSRLTLAIAVRGASFTPASR